MTFLRIYPTFLISLKHFMRKTSTFLSSLDNACCKNTSFLKPAKPISEETDTHPHLGHHQKVSATQTQQTHTCCRTSKIHSKPITPFYGTSHQKRSHDSKPSHKSGPLMKSNETCTELLWKLYKTPPEQMLKCQIMPFRLNLIAPHCLIKVQHILTNADPLLPQ